MCQGDCFQLNVIIDIVLTDRIDGKYTYKSIPIAVLLHSYGMSYMANLKGDLINQYTAIKNPTNELNPVGQEIVSLFICLRPD